jgi:monoterpene epsilon-lactone hydrolase
MKMLTPNLEKMTPEIQEYMKISAKRINKTVLQFLLHKKVKIEKFKEIIHYINSATETSYKIQTFEPDVFKGFSFEDANIATQFYRYSIDAPSMEELKLYLKQTPKAKRVKIKPFKVQSLSTYWFVPPGCVDEKVFYYIHGGGMIMGSTAASRSFCIEMALLTNIRVLSVDYRLAPEHPHPAQIDDVEAVYDWLLASGIKPKNIIIGGESAGGQLTLMLLNRLKKEKKEMPAGAVLLSPGVDVSIINKAMFTNALTDPVLFTSGGLFLIAYVLQHVKTDVLNMDYDPIRFDLNGYPPLLLQASKQEMLYFGAEKFNRQAKAAGVDIVFQVWEGMTHGFEVYSRKYFKEVKEANLKIAEFISGHLFL